MTPTDDRDLIEGCRRGDRRAWRRTLDRYGRLVYSIPLQLGLSTDDADDVAQATFAEFLAGIDSIVTDDRLGAWLGTVARRQSIRLIERRERDRHGLDALPHDLVDHDEWTARVAEIEWVDQALAQLPERCRHLLVLLYFTDPPSSYERIAAALDMPIGSVGPTRGRCLASLETELARRATED